MKNIKLGLLGFGNVGKGVFKILNNNAESIEQKVGGSISIEKILVRDVKKDRGIEVNQDLLTDNVDTILEDPNIGIVVELLGGIEPAKEYVLKAFQAGKTVVTANKDLIAQHGEELFAMAKEHNCDFLFEGSVGGGIPIIRPLKQCLAANKIEEVMGIINGTTNYMLTKMTNEGSNFEDVLTEAQAKGYAESDPTADIEGYDAARKLAILASIAFNTRVTLDNVYVEGITKITAEDITYAKELGYIIKLLAVAKNLNGKVEVRVHPTFISQKHPLAAVNDVYNAIFIKGDAVGEAMFFGRGAGEMPTGSAVAGDILDAARNILRNDRGRISCTCFVKKPIKNMGETKTKYYIRLKVADKPGVLANIASVFGNQDVSLNSVIQKKIQDHNAELVLITHEVLEKNIQDALQIIRGLSTVETVANLIRVE